MRKYRNEIKYIISKNSAEILKRKLLTIMSVDENKFNSDNSYIIKSLYFDDINSNAYYEKIDGVEYRKKYRIRTYNNDLNVIRLECKYKHENKTSKDQMLITKPIYDKIISGNMNDIDINEDNLLTKFIVDSKLENLVPSTIVEYKRVALTYPISDIRITFDYDIKSGLYNYDLFDKDITSYNVLDDNQVVLEVKFNEILPETIAIILATVPTLRQAFSKFAVCRSIK